MYLTSEILSVILIFFSLQNKEGLKRFFFSFFFFTVMETKISCCKSDNVFFESMKLMNW